MRYFFSLISTFIIALLTFILFITKKRVKSQRTSVFTRMIVGNVFALANEIITIYYLSNNTDPNILITNLLFKTYMIYTCMLVSQLSIYVFSLCYEKNRNDYFKKIKLYSIFSCILVSCVMCCLPIYINGTIGIGPAKNIVVIYVVFHLSFWLYTSIKNIRKFEFSVLGPVFLFSILAIVGIVIELLDSSLPVVTQIQFALIFLMYLTMENTDYTMIATLKKKQDEAMESYNQKSEFLKNMSHEIRTPLNGLIGLSEDINQYKNSVPKELYDASNRLINNSNILLDVVANVININKGIDLNDNVNLVNYNINTLMNDINKESSRRITDNTSLDISIKGDLLDLYGDKDHVKNIIIRLLNNSIYSTSEGIIKIEVEVIEKKKDILLLLIKIFDNGKGIHKDIMPYIYDFNNDDIVNNEHYDAKLLLNTTVAKKQVDLLNGKISITSEYEKGTNVEIEIPQYRKRGEE